MDKESITVVPQASMMPLETDDGFSGLPMATPGLISERAPPTPWHDDYEMAPSVGPVRNPTSLCRYRIFILFIRYFRWTSS